MIAMINRQREHATKLFDQVTDIAQGAVSFGVRSTRTAVGVAGGVFSQLVETIGTNGDPSSSSGPGAQIELDDLTTAELYTRAQERNVRGRSKMSRDELVAALSSDRSE